MPKEKKKSTLPPKPDEKSHPDPLKRFKALKEWRKTVNEILGETEVMKWKPEKTLDKAGKELDKVTKEEGKKQDKITKEVIAIEKEIGATKDPKKKLSLKEQIAKLKAIKKKKKENKEKNEPK